MSTTERPSASADTLTGVLLAGGSVAAFFVAPLWYGLSISFTSICAIGGLSLYRAYMRDLETELIEERVRNEVTEESASLAEMNVTLFDATAPIREGVAGYKAALVNLGMSDETAEQMAAAFHERILRDS